MSGYTHVITYDGGVLVSEIGGGRDISTFSNPLHNFNGDDQWRFVNRAASNRTSTRSGTPSATRTWALSHWTYRSAGAWCEAHQPLAGLRRRRSR